MGKWKEEANRMYIALKKRKEQKRQGEISANNHICENYYRIQKRNRKR